MFYQLCALASIVLVLCLAAIRRCSIYSPLMISASVWLVTFIAGLIFQERFYPIQENAFIAWFIWFMVTSMIFFLLYPSRVKTAWSRTEIRRIPFDYTVPLLLMIVWLGYRIWVVGNTGTDQFFFNLRMSAINLGGFASLGLVTRFYPLVFALFLFEHVYAHQENRHLRLLLWCWMLLYAVASMGKSQFLTLILSWVIIQGIKGRMKVGTLVLLATVAFALMMALHFTRASYESTIIDVLAIYIYSPIVALGYLDIKDLMPFGAYVFRFIYVIANYLGIAPLPVTTITPYVKVPELTNAYTVMQPFYHDFGMLGVPLQAVIYGLFFSCLYSLSIKKGSIGELGLVLFSGYSIVLVVQFAGDLLVMNLSGNLQFLIYTIIVFLVSKKACYVS